MIQEKNLQVKLTPNTINPKITYQLNQNEQNNSSRNFIKQNIINIQTNLTKSLSNDLFRISSKSDKYKNLNKFFNQQYKQIRKIKATSKKQNVQQTTHRTNKFANIIQMNADVLPAQTERILLKYRKISTKLAQRKSVKNIGQFNNNCHCNKIKYKTCCDQQNESPYDKIQLKDLINLNFNTQTPRYIPKYNNILTSINQPKKQNFFKVTGLKAPFKQISDHYKIKTICKKLDLHFQNQKIKKSMTLSSFKNYPKLL